MQDILREAIKNLPFDQLTPLQEESAKCTSSKSQVVIAPTGSGKTLAFLLALLSSWDFTQKGVQAIILSPTRELAMQINKVVQQLRLPIHTQCVYGGHDINTEINRLKNECDLIVATPGRLIDLLHREAITSDSMSCLVFDEYDKLLELGFQEEIDEILSFIPANRFILSSATQPKSLPSSFQNLETETISGERLVEIEKFKLIHPENQGDEYLLDILYAHPKDQTIVFCEFRENTEIVGTFLEQNGLYVSVFHGGLEQDERKRALLKFKNGSNQVLVCTDLGARGLDIPQVSLVIHRDFPSNEDQETHRNGRTGRMGAKGTVVYMLAPNQAESKSEIAIFDYPEAQGIPPAPKWVTIYFSAGKKQKIRKGDLLGFLTKDAGIKGKDIGLIEVEDNSSFVAIDRTVWNDIKGRMRKQRVKNQRLKIEEAR